MKSTEIVKLNVGGKLFVTSRNTLSLAKMIDCIVNSKVWMNPEEDTIYFDQDGKTFGYVLNLLRGEITDKDIPEKYIDRVIKQLDYFGVDIVVEKEKDKNEKPFKVLEKKYDLETEISRVERYLINEYLRITNISQDSKIAVIRLKLNPKGIEYKLKIYLEYHSVRWNIREYSKHLGFDDKTIIIPIGIEILNKCDLVIDSSECCHLELLYTI